jgi:hypothetical protein
MLSILMLMKDDLFDGKQQSDRAKSNKNIKRDLETKILDFCCYAISTSLAMGF